MENATNDFASQPIPPRLTPSPPPSSTDDELPNPHRIPTPPLRRSIYPHTYDTTWFVNVTPYSPSWPLQFTSIATHLHTLFTNTSPPAPYVAIEHIGSTSIPDLAAKPNIDILATFPSHSALAAAVEALNWEIPTMPPFARYTQIPAEYRLPGRESFKIYLPEDNYYYATTPERSLYLIADVEDNEAGRVQIRGYRTVRDVLRRPENRDLLDGYAKLKLELAKRAFKTPQEYAELKDGIIRKILVRGGWTDEEVDDKETLTRKEWNVDEEDYPY